jgi:hypothetical protein
VVIHWSDKYIGEPYVPEVGDCAALAAKVNYEQFKKLPDLPNSHADTLRDQSKQIVELKDDLAVKIDEPFDGCPVLLIGRGRLCHIGVMCWIANEWWVLHADQSAGFVVRQRLRELTRLHYKVEGFYQWK